jgi:hypothetical protein
MAGGFHDPREWPIVPQPSSLLDFLVDLIPIRFIRDLYNTLTLRELREQFLAPVSSAETARQIAMSTRSCGFGLRGFYYNVETHTGADAFAIDFTDYNGFSEASDFWPVLAAVSGRVVYSHFTFPNWGPRLNAVEVSTFEEGDEYISRYLHLARDRTPPIRVGMFIPRGTFMAQMQSTGNSVIPHLHFSIHDQTRPHPSGELTLSGIQKGISVRPTLMDGVHLEHDDQSTCLASSNGGVPSIAILQPNPLDTIPTSTVAQALSTSVTGGARPVTISWTSNREIKNPISSGPDLLQTYVFRVPGRQILTATVSDALGRTGRASVAVDVQNSPAIVSIVSPADVPAGGSSFASNERVPLHGRTWDPDTGEPLRESQVFWFLDGETRAFATEHRGRIEPGTLSVGRHRIRFVGNDNGTEIEAEHTFEITPAVSNRQAVKPNSHNREIEMSAESLGRLA